MGSRGRGNLWHGVVSGRCHYCNKEGHWKNECFKRKGNLQKSSAEGDLAFMGLEDWVREKGQTDWIIDSGVSRHLTARRELLRDYISIVPTSITIRNGKDITAIGQGNISLHTATGTISLVPVLFVTDIVSNLISVASIVDQGFQVEFTKTVCIVSQGTTARVIGKRQGNIYFLSRLQEIALAGQLEQKDKTRWGIWHKRLGQRSLSQQSVRRIAESVANFNLSEYDKDDKGVSGACAEGKQTWDYLTGERDKSKELLHTIHSDVCGPMSVTGLMGERYFTTFMDDAS